MSEDNIKDVFYHNEELCDELKLYLNKNSKLGICLQHPLVYSVPHNEALNALVNLQYKTRKKVVDHCLKNKEYEKYVFLHERPWRLRAFIEIHHHLSHKSYWETLGSIWVDSENIWQNRDTWIDLLSSKRGSREYFMDENERQVFKELPEKVTAYRGYVKGKNKNGLSYSLDKEKAIWFSKRWFSKTGALKTVTVNKERIFAFISNEQEVIILP